MVGYTALCKKKEYIFMKNIHTWPEKDLEIWTPELIITISESVDCGYRQWN